MLKTLSMYAQHFDMSGLLLNQLWAYANSGLSELASQTHPAVLEMCWSATGKSAPFCLTVSNDLKKRGINL